MVFSLFCSVERIIVAFVKKQFDTYQIGMKFETILKT